MNPELTALRPVAAPELASAARQARLVNMSEFLAFKLNAEEYCIDILRVQEIRSYESPTRFANAPEFVKGVINLRGSIVPIVDMRLKFKLPSVTYDGLTVVIVLNVGKQVIGMVVDSVSDVVSLTPVNLLPVPVFAGKLDREHVLAIGSLQDRMLIVLDIERLMSSDAIGIASEREHQALAH